MKRLIGSVTLLLLICCYLWSCEKDDLCPDSTPTTPSLIIRFYNADNHAALKKVDNLKVFMEGSDTITLGTVDSIALPLRTDVTATRWALQYNRASSSTPGTFISDTDIIEFKYTTREAYVSRACGYKVMFTLDEGTNANPNPVVTDVPEETHLWIDEFTIENKNIENENKAHVKIYF